MQLYPGQGWRRERSPSEGTGAVGIGFTIILVLVGLLASQAHFMLNFIVLF
jgi:hypothetical protein